MKAGIMGPPVLAIPLLALAGFASAQAPQCASIDDVLARLAERYGEAVFWTGVTQDGIQLVITANPDGSSWTTLLVRADGIACFTVAGSRWLPGGAPVSTDKEG